MPTPIEEKYRRIRNQLTTALLQLEEAQRKIAYLEGQQLKTKWHIARASSRLDEALEELSIPLPPAPLQEEE
jgi:predicted  nucleic acid-binding Zn-ribbon protein